MSYDLFFCAPPGASLPTLEALRTWAAGHTHFKINDTTSQLWYENPATGVYASFDLTLTDDATNVPTGIAFNLNYMRPDFFGLEALPIALHLAETFNLGMDDCNSDTDPGQLSLDALLSSWRRGNTFGINAMAALSVDNKPVMARDDAEAMWRYCHRLREIEQALDETYVPKLFPVLHEGAAKRLSFMPGPTTYALPPCDLLYFSRGGDTVIVEARHAREHLLGPYLVNDDTLAGVEIIPEAPLFDTDLMQEWDDYVATAEPFATLEDIKRLAMDGFLTETPSRK